MKRLNCGHISILFLGPEHSRGGNLEGNQFASHVPHISQLHSLTQGNYKSIKLGLLQHFVFVKFFPHFCCGLTLTPRKIQAHVQVQTLMWTSNFLMTVLDFEKWVAFQFSGPLELCSNCTRNHFLHSHAGILQAVTESAPGPCQHRGEGGGH